MALIAEDAADRVEQLLILTQRLIAIASDETRRIEARQPLPGGAQSEEKSRLANAYRLELARIRQEPVLIAGAPDALLADLRRNTELLHATMTAHGEALGAVKLVAEGLVHAMAEEVARQRNAGARYGADGGVNAPAAPGPTLLDRSA
jgi:hypothetical protein